MRRVILDQRSMNIFILGPSTARSINFQMFCSEFCLWANWETKVMVLRPLSLFSNQSLGLGLGGAMLNCFRGAQLSETPRAVTHQDPLSMGILQARILEWVAISSSRGSSWPRDWTHVSRGSCIAGRFLTVEPPGREWRKLEKLCHMRLQTHSCLREDQL